MPLPLNLDKALSFGKQVANNIAKSISDTAAGASVAITASLNRVVARVASSNHPVITTIKWLALAGAVAVGISLVVIGGILAFSAIASLGAIGALTASFLAAGAIGFTLTQVVSTVINTTNFVFNFNVNQSDAERQD